MKDKIHHDITTLILYVIYGLIFIAPLALLILSATGNAQDELINIPLALFNKTIMLNALTAFAAMALGLVVALAIWTACPKGAFRCALLLLLFSLIPEFIHIQAWIFTIDYILFLINPFLAQPLNFGGEFAVVLTGAFSKLSLCSAFTLLGLISIPQHWIDLLALETKNAIRAYFIMTSWIANYLLSGGLLVFMLLISDFSLPSLFGVNVYTLLLYSYFAAGKTAPSILLTALPIILLNLTLLILIWTLFFRRPFNLPERSSKNHFKNAPFSKMISGLGKIVLAIYLIVPLFTLLTTALNSSDAASVISQSKNQIAISFAVAAATALLGTFLIAILLVLIKQKRRPLVVVISAVSFTLPAPIVGLAFIKLFNSAPLTALYHSALMPVVATIGRYGFVSALFIYIALSNIDQSHYDAMEIFCPDRFSKARCILGMIGTAIAIGAIAIFTLTINDFTISLLLVPPGVQTLTIKIYNYLHYGASSTIAMLCLMTLVISLTAIFISFLLINRIAKKNAHIHLSTMRK